jgi:hypothetical protein
MLHQIKRRPDYACVVAIRKRARHWHFGYGKGADDAKFPVDSMRRRQQRSGR